LFDQQVKYLWEACWNGNPSQWIVAKFLRTVEDVIYNRILIFRSAIIFFRNCQASSYFLFTFYFDAWWNVATFVKNLLL